MNLLRSSLTCLIVAFIVIGLQPPSVAAQSVDPSDRVHEIAKRLNCPTCAGRNLADCPTDTCMQWKQEIRTQLDSGKTNDQVISYFYDRFGTAVLQEPPREGLLLLVWLLPIFGFVALGTGAILLLRRIHKSTHITAISPGAMQREDEYSRRFEEEIQA